MEGYANLDHWVAELDQRIEGILLQRVTLVIQQWCSEFERADDSDGRREPVTLKRRDKRAKDDKVRKSLRICRCRLADGTKCSLRKGS